MNKLLGNQPRSSVSLTDLSGTPFVDNFLSKLPLGHEKALKYAFYNVFALILAFALVLALWGVYCILEPFIKALLWALLCGSVLHPVKEKICTFARTWLKNIKTSSTPFTISILASPLKIADNISESIGSYIFSWWKSILSGFALFIVTYIIYYNSLITIIAEYFLAFLTTTFAILSWTLSWLNLKVIFTLNSIYFGSFIHYILFTRKSDPIISSKSKHEQTTSTSTFNISTTKSQNTSIDETDLSTVPSLPENDKYLKNIVPFVSYITWISTSAYIILQLPYWAIISLTVFVIIGAITYIRRTSRAIRNTLPSISRYACMVVLNIGASNTLGEFANTIKSPLSPMKRRIQLQRGESTTDSSAGSTEIYDSVKKIKPKSPFRRSMSELTPKGSVGATTTKADENEPVESISLFPNLFPSMKFPSPSSTISPNKTWNNDNDDDSKDEIDGSLIDSNKFLYGVFISCLLVHVWNHLWLLNLLPIPIAYYGLKKFITRFNILKYISENVQQPIIEFYDSPDSPSQYLFPHPIRVMFKVLQVADKKVVKICENYIDPVASSLVLILLVLSTILGLIFTATQIYGEGDHLVRVSANLINSTVSQHPEINQVLPEGWETIMDSMAENAYVYGKEYITNSIRDSIAEKNPQKAEQIESQVIELWDRIYLSWNQIWHESHIEDKIKIVGKNENSTRTIMEVLEGGGKDMPNLLEISLFANYAKANLGTIWTILESFWNILIGNISIAVSAIYAIISFLFGGGSAIVNLLINLVVFFTALFYLLNASSDVYKPVELFNLCSIGSGYHTNSFAIAVEDSINGVFVASFKMAAFYGMWTWLIHTLFQVNIVFVPSILAALFAAIPFLSPYWAAFPAVLELWLIQGFWYKALLMMLAQMAPMSIVDTQIYSEIKGGGHPYLTGLAVAGGIFCFGVQGAVLGPVILCCVVVAVKIGGSFLREVSENVDPSLISQSQPHKNKRMTETAAAEASNYPTFSSSTPI